MPDTLFLLRLEHGNQSEIIGLIEGQLAAAAAGARMDVDLLRLASEYFSDYPARCHHPKEDLVYRLLIERDPDARAGLLDLSTEHVRLQQLTEAFAAAVRELGEEPQGASAGPKPGPLGTMREFTRQYRRHMREEDEHFFRLAEARLSRDDWDKLNFAVFDRDDPLFDHAAEERYAALRERIAALAEQGKARQSVQHAAEALRGLAGVESFNESMKAAGQAFRLARFAEGGYGLELGRKLLLYVPECSAERAAWCAYCYLRGLGWPWNRPPPPGKA